MIYGLLPVGGKGMRLALPFPKELLPQKGFNRYNPIINHVVGKMEDAGAERIVFVHGEEFKEGIRSHYSGPNYIHIKQTKPGFAMVLKDFVDAIPLKDEDIVLFGLPDSIFEGNPFRDMVLKDGIVCGLFFSDPYAKVDRLSKTEPVFQVKTAKHDDNQNWFWGVLKFGSTDLKRIMFDRMLEQHTEIGDILNHYPKSFVHGDTYLDLGTWYSYNRYLTLFDGRYDD
jgi:hypothetical protein